MSRVYLDWNATAPIRAEAAARLVEVLSATGNPSSMHAEGRAARASVEAARAEVGALVGAKASGVTFTSGGTEAIATAMRPDWLVGGKPRRFARALIGATEHAAMLAGDGFAAEARDLLPVDREGRLDLSVLAGRLAGLPPALVAVQLANNETGVLQPIADIARCVHVQRGILVCDAVQAAGRIELDIATLGADALILSGHKIGGPQGVGALVLASEATAPAAPLIRGGGQERGRRGGTEAGAAIAAFGVAARLAAMERGAAATRVAALRDRLEAGLGERVPEAVVFGRRAPRLPNTSLIGLDGAPASTLLMGLDLAGFAVSSGSACSSGKVKRSHVLDAMGIAPSLAGSAIRVSLGRTTSDDDVDRFLEAFETAAKCLYKRASAA